MRVSRVPNTNASTRARPATQACTYWSSMRAYGDIEPETSQTSTRRRGRCGLLAPAALHQLAAVAQRRADGGAQVVHLAAPARRASCAGWCASARGGRSARAAGGPARARRRCRTRSPSRAAARPRSTRRARARSPPEAPPRRATGRRRAAATASGSRRCPSAGRAPAASARPRTCRRTPREHGLVGARGAQRGAQREEGLDARRGVHGRRARGARPAARPSPTRAPPARMRGRELAQRAGDGLTRHAALPARGRDRCPRAPSARRRACPRGPGRRRARAAPAPR